MPWQHVRIRTELVRTFRETSVPIRTDSFYIRDIFRQGFSDLGYAILYTTWLCHFIAIKWQNLYKMAPTLYNGCTHPPPRNVKGMFCDVLCFIFPILGMIYNILQLFGLCANWTKKRRIRWWDFFKCCFMMRDVGDMSWRLFNFLMFEKMFDYPFLDDVAWFVEVPNINCEKHILRASC